MRTIREAAIFSRAWMRLNDSFSELHMTVPRPLRSGWLMSRNLSDDKQLTREQTNSFSVSYNDIPVTRISC